jgi:hypothetical protein
MRPPPNKNALQATRDGRFSSPSYRDQLTEKGAKIGVMTTQRGRTVLRDGTPTPEADDSTLP